MSDKHTTSGQPATTLARQPRSAPPSPLGVPLLPARVHLLGAGGAGVSGAALLLHRMGVEVTACDLAESEHTRMLREQGVPIEVGDAACARLPEDAELLVRSAAVPTSDPVVGAAAARGLGVLKYSELLGRVAPVGRTLAVAGTHGKTSTSWMLHHALTGIADHAGPRPGAVVGGISVSLGVNAVSPELGGWFTAEACEYDRSFLNLAPRGALITNVEADHLDYFGDLDAIKSAFARFADRIHPDGLLVVGEDVPRSIEDVARCRVWRLGRDLKVQLLGERNGHFTMSLVGPEFHLPGVTLAVPGRFSVDNAALALGLAVDLAGASGGLEPSEAARHAARGLEQYVGCRRRFERWGRVGGVEVVHDYAHHPTEVRVTLEAARRVLPGRPLHVLFQPHQYSRTSRFLREFAESLRFADRVVVCDVYGARTHIDGEYTAGSQELVSEVRALGVEAAAGGSLQGSIEALAQGLPGDAAVLVLGAGDIGGIRYELLERLALSGPARSGSRR